MKVITSYIFRFICAIIIGVLLILYSTETARYITIAIGAVFFISGVVAVVNYYIALRHQDDTVVYDAEGRQLTGLKPSFPLAGWGSILLGAILALMPGTFINFLMYILAALLILGSIHLFVGLGSARRIAVIGLGWWIMPSLLLIVGILCIVRPMEMFAAPYVIIGYALIIYGLVELINALKVHRVRRFYEQQQASSQQSSVVEEQPQIEEQKP